jgi:hypothetical protein
MLQDKIRISATIALCALGLVFMLLREQAEAQTWPQRPVKIIVPSDPALVSTLLQGCSGSAWRCVGGSQW